MEDDFREFLILLKEAGAAMGPHYFQLPPSEEDRAERPAFPERIYCYELYHQMRSLFEKNGFRYELDGEVDASGHPIIRGTLKPDFIVHGPRTQGRNLVAIEVRPANTGKKDLKKDISTLDGFIRGEARYYRGIMLVYGNGQQGSPAESVLIAQRLIRRFNDRILLLWHPGPGQRPVLINSHV